MSKAGSVFMVGLPTVYPGPVLDRVKAMGVPVLISANAMPIAKWSEQRELVAAGELNHDDADFSYAQAWLADWDFDLTDEENLGFV